MLSKAHTYAELDVMLPAKPGTIRVHVTDSTTNAQVEAFKINLKIPGRKDASEMSIEFHPDLGEMKDREIAVPPDADFLINVTADGYLLARLIGDLFSGR